MGVNYVAVADGVLVSERAVDVHENVVDGVHAVHGTRCELSFCDEEVPTDPALTFIGLRTNLYGTRTKVDHDALAWEESWDKRGKGRGKRQMTGCR